jgi:hypothetical protein
MWRTFAAVLLATSVLAGATSASAMGAGGAGGGGMGAAGTNYGTSTMPNYMPPADASTHPVKHVQHKHKHKYVEKP